MDTRRIDEADPAVAFDILKTWVSDGLARQVPEGKLQSSGWEALTQAIHRAVREQRRDVSHAAAQCISHDFNEQELRVRIVNAYRQQDEAVTERLIQAKLDDPWSFFSRIGYESFEKAKQNWEWYLWCLTCPSSEFHEWSTSVGLEGWGCADMPLDSVDLQLVAATFNARVIVSQLMEPGIAFEDPQGARYCVHLAMHRGFWAPVLGTRALDTELREMVGAVVQLGEFTDGRLQTFDNKLACVDRFDTESECFMVGVDNVVIPVERGNIKFVVLHEGIDSSGAPRFDYNSAAEVNKTAEAVKLKDNESGKVVEEDIKPQAPGEGKKIRGIPDTALEFQILMEQVRRLARIRLQDMMQELAGRTSTTTGGQRASCTGAARTRNAAKFEAVPTPSRIEIARQQQNRDRDRMDAAATLLQHTGSLGKPTRLPLDDALSKMKANMAFKVMAICQNDAHDRNQLAVEADDELLPTDCNEPWMCCTKEASNAAGLARGWVPLDRLLVYKVKTAWRPEKQADAQAKYLTLEVGDLVIIKSRYSMDWSGWCYGEFWEGKQGEGIFHKSFLCDPFFLVRA